MSGTAGNQVNASWSDLLPDHHHCQQSRQELISEGLTCTTLTANRSFLQPTRVSSGCCSNRQQQQQLAIRSLHVKHQLLTRVDSFDFVSNSRRADPLIGNYISVAQSLLFNSSESVSCCNDDDDDDDASVCSSLSSSNHHYPLSPLNNNNKLAVFTTLARPRRSPTLFCKISVAA